MPTKVFFGRGESKKLPKLVGKLEKKKILLVVGKHFFSDTLVKSLVNTGKVEVYSEFINKSDFDTVNILARYCHAGNFDGVIGIGGGAILDSVKVAASLVVNGGEAENYLLSGVSKITRPSLFCIALPTTAGTGSETTPWAVVWGDKKYSFQSEFMFPDIAIVDPALTDDCPRYVTATAGIDALCQSIEAYWNVHHNPKSDEYALESVTKILGSLDDAVNSPSRESRDKMSWGSLTGGLAFSNTATTICHSVSYPMTLYWGVTHGQATSITLPIFIEYTFPILSEKRRRNLLSSTGVGDAKKAAEKIRILMKSIGLKTRLSELGIPREGIDVIVSEGFDSSRANNSPNVPTPQKLKRLLTSIY